VFATIIASTTVDLQMRVSIVIPTLNEASTLAATIERVRERAFFGCDEIVVADCGSVDGTRLIASNLGVRVIHSPTLTSRFAACNAGARCTKGDVILFLHADSQVPLHFDKAIAAAVAQPNVVGGAFEFALDGSEWRLRFVELVNRLRYRVRGRFFGDQGIFARRDVFEEIGGFPDRRLLEDAHFCANLRRVGRVKLISRAMVTSARRFHNGGILRTLMLDVLIILTDFANLNPDRFAALYARDNRRRGQAVDQHTEPTRDRDMTGRDAMLESAVRTWRSATTSSRASVRPQPEQQEIAIAREHAG
jgi:rSAM/selenodomain-associated transferase 2